MLKRSRLIYASLLAFLGVTAAGSDASAIPAFKHIIIVVQENRTPDNIFGSNPTFEPGVDISNTIPGPGGQQIPLTAAPLTVCWDPDHSHGGFETELQSGFAAEPVHPRPGCTLPPQPALTYADNSTGQLQPYFDIATNYGFANRMFQTNQGPSFPAHLFLFGGTSAPSSESPLFLAENLSQQNQPIGCLSPPTQTTSLIDGFGVETKGASSCGDHQTLADLLSADNLSWRYYTPSLGSIWSAPVAIAHLCEAQTQSNGSLICTGAAFTHKLVNVGNPARVLTDIATCNLANVSWVIPASKQSDHPVLTDGSGPSWVASILNAVGENAACPTGETYWQDTAVIITWDDWGGFADHVAPFEINIQPTSQPQWGDGYTYGYRVPLLIASAYTPAGLVDNGTHDFGSILQFVEQNFGLPFIGDGATIYGNYADYQAAARGDSLDAFFPLTTPRAFIPIAAPQPPSYFLAQPGPFDGPDTD